MSYDILNLLRFRILHILNPGLIFCGIKIFYDTGNTGPSLGTWTTFYHADWMKVWSTALYYSLDVVNPVFVACEYTIFDIQMNCHNDTMIIFRVVDTCSSFITNYAQNWCTEIDDIIFIYMYVSIMLTTFSF